MFSIIIPIVVLSISFIH